MTEHVSAEYFNHPSRFPFHVPLEGRPKLDALAAIESLPDATYTRLNEVRDQIKESELLLELAKRVYLGEFVRDAKAAAALYSHRHSNARFNIRFGRDVTNHQIDTYLEPFQQQKSVNYPFPTLRLPAVAVMSYNGKEFSYNRYGPMALSPHKHGHLFSEDIYLPQLLDPRPLTFEQFEALPRLDSSDDSSDTTKVRDAYQQALAEQCEKHPASKFQDPVVFRVVAALPVGREYRTDFLPQIELAEKYELWDARLLVGGELNAPGEYVGGSSVYDPWRRIAYKSDGRQMALRASRATHGAWGAEPESTIALSWAGQDYYDMAAILFPSEIWHAPRPNLSLPSEASGESSSGYRTAQAAGKVAVGESGIDSLPDSSPPAGHEKIGCLGDTTGPKANGRPLIYSIRLFAVSADRPT